MGLSRLKMPPKFQLLGLLAFAIVMIFLENQIQKLEESRGKLGKNLSIPIKYLQNYKPAKSGLCPFVNIIMV